MKKYDANSYYLIIRVFSLIVLVAIIGVFIKQLDTPKYTFYGGIIIISLLVIWIIKLLKNIVYIGFYEDNMEVTHLITRVKKIIPYSDLIDLVCVDSRVGHHYNTIKFKADNLLGTSNIKVDRIVDSDQFITFLKWLKNKNKNIEFEIIPSDSKLLSEFNKEF